jgi:hypothetical protein
MRRDERGLLKPGGYYACHLSEPANIGSEEAIYIGKRRYQTIYVGYRQRS